MSAENAQDGDGPLERALENLERAQAHQARAREEEALADLEVEKAVEKVEEVIEDEHERVEVSLVWGGTGESKPAKVRKSDSAGQVFDLVYDKFGQAPRPEDTFEVNATEFPRTRFSETVKHLLHEFGDKLAFEVIPPTSGA